MSIADITKEIFRCLIILSSFSHTYLHHVYYLEVPVYYIEVPVYYLDVHANLNRTLKYTNSSQFQIGI